MKLRRKIKYLLICSPHFDDYGPYRVYSSFSKANKVGSKWVKLNPPENENASYNVEEVEIK